MHTNQSTIKAKKSLFFFSAGENADNKAGRKVKWKEGTPKRREKAINQVRKEGNQGTVEYTEQTW